MMLSIADVAAFQVPTGTLDAVLVFLKTTCVLLAALAVTVAMRRASAGARHLVWLVALASLLVLPALAAWGPVAIPVLPAVSAPAPTPALASPTVAAPPTVAPPASRVSAVTPASATAAPDTLARLRALGVIPWLLALWATGVLALLVRLGLGAWGVRRIVRGARVLEHPDWQRPLYEVADRLGLEQPPQLLQSDRVKIPFACGLWRARIVLPADSEGWSAARRSAVLIHELGHVRRRDLLGHAVGRLACALYWFHPLVWSAARRMRIESERACDDLALMLGARPSEYAEHLLDIVTQVRDHGTPAVALAMANPNEFEGRMLAILDPHVRRRTLGRLQAAWLGGALLLVASVVGAVSLAPQAAATSPGVPPSDDVLAVVAPDDAPTPRHETTEPSRVVEEADPGSTAEEPADPEAVDPSTEENGVEVVHEESGSEEEALGRRIDVLVKSLRDDPSPEVRRVAAWGLERFAHASLAARELAEAMVSDESVEVREMAAWALNGSRGEPSVVTALYAAFRRDKSAHVRRTAAWTAGCIGNRAAVPGLVGLLSSGDAHLREVAAWAIGSCSPERAPDPLVRLLSDPEPIVRLSAAWALREIGDPGSADALEAAFQRERNTEVQHGMIRALGSMGERAVTTLTRLLDSSDPEIRKVAVTALAGGNATGPWPWPRPEPRPFP